jgi:fibronectin-binding autotransporter adhesin
LISGTGGLSVGDGDDPGTVVLTNSNNSYTGGTTVGVGAKLSVSQNGALGDLIGAITLDGGEMLGTGSFSTNRPITLTSNDGILAAVAGGMASFSGSLTSIGSLFIGDTVNTGTVTLGGTNTYSGGTVIVAGTLQIGNGGVSGSILGDVTDNGNLAFNHSDDVTFSGAVSGTGTLNQKGPGTLFLTGDNTYAGGTTIGGGTLQIGNAGTSGSIVGNVIDNSALVFDRSDGVVFGGIISGTGTLGQVGPGTLTLTGMSSYTGATAVTAGTLEVDGALGNTAVTVQSGATLAGQGMIAGSVTIQDGGHLSPGPGAQTLSVGSLLLNPASILDYRLGTPGTVGSGVNTLVNVAGNLTLNGVLKVTNGGSFGSGSYRLLNYGGALTNLTLDLGILPDGFTAANTTVTTAVAGQVNLVVNAAGAPVQFWDGSNTVNDGTVHGGSGTWINFVTTNFTNAAGTVNQAWQNGFAIFTAAPGTVTLGGDILFQAMQFSVDRYTIVGAEAFALHPTGTAMIITDTGVTATIDAPIAGTGGLNKAGPGLLTLTGENTYSGSTTISGGVLRVGTDTNLGDPSGTVTLAGGELLTTDDGFNTARAVDISPSQGNDILAAVTGTTATYTGILSDAGALVVGDDTHAGTVVLTGTNTYSGGTAINSGTLQIGDGVRSGSIIGDVTDNGTIALNPNGSVTFGGAITGTGNLVKMGSGIVILTANNSYTGNTTISAGTLQLGNGGISGEIVGNVIDNGNLTFNRSDAVTFSGNVSGTGTLGQNSLGTLTLTGANTYTGGTTISAGTLQIGDGGTSGSFVGDVVDNGNLVFDRSDAVTFVGIVSGTGTLGQNGPGSLTLTGATTYTGGTTISAGTLQLGDGGTSGSIVGDVIDNGSLAFNRSDTVTFSGNVSGTGSLSKIGPGTLVLTGNNTYSGGTNVFPGTLLAAGNNTLGTGLVQLFNATLIIPAEVTLTNEVAFVAGGVLNNAGTLNGNVGGASSMAQVVINSGTINGNVQLAGATDTVHLFIGSKITGSLGLSGGANSTLILDGAGQNLLSLAVTGTLTNNGSLVKEGSGTWTVDRALDAPFGTDILSGILVLDAALTTAQVNVTSGAFLQLNSGGRVGNLVDNGSLIFAGSDTVTFGAGISGTGNVIQNGPGTTILSGRNTYSGGTIIDLGTLLVNNPQALGTGNVTINGGILGADPQPINVLGNYTQNAAGTLQLNVAGRAPGQFDVLNVAGNASLSGTLRLLNLGYQPQNGDKLRLVNTGGTVSGRFAQFQNPFTFGAGFNTVGLVYARQSVTLEFLELNNPSGVVSTTDFSSFALTPNERAAASLLDAVQPDPKAANLISFLNKEPFAHLPGDFNKISPDGLTAFYEISFTNANIQRLNIESRLDDVRNGSNGFSSNMKVNGASVNLDGNDGVDGKSSTSVVEPVLQPGPENRWGVWMTGFGDFVSVDADANANGYNFTTGGVSLGIDYRITDQLAIGVMGEYSHTWTSLQPSGNIDVNSGRGGLYATWSDHGIYLNAAIYGGRNNYDSSRSGLKGLATGATGGGEWSTFISGGYDFHFGPLTVGPIAALQYTYAKIDGFSENGSLVPMRIESNSVNSLRSDVGFRLFCQWHLGKVIVEPSIKAAWEHEYLYSALPITAGFAGVPGPSATFVGPREGHDSAIVSAGVSVQWTPAITIYVNYDGQLGRQNYDSNAVTGGVRIGF